MTATYIFGRAPAQYEMAIPAHPMLDQLDEALGASHLGRISKWTFGK